MQIPEERTDRTTITREERNYLPEEREQALLVMAATSSRKAAETTGIPDSTIRNWSSTQEGRALIEQARRQFSGFVAERAKTIFDKATAQVLDRLDNGDARLLPDGSIVRVPMAGRDAAVVGGIYYDKWKDASELQLQDGSASVVTPDGLARIEAIKALLVKEMTKRSLRDKPIDVEPISETADTESLRSTDLRSDSSELATPFENPSDSSPSDDRATSKTRHAVGLGVDHASDDALSHHPPDAGDSPPNLPARTKKRIPVAGRDRKLRKDAGTTRGRRVKDE